jgi:hypothetical protein
VTRDVKGKLVCGWNNFKVNVTLVGNTSVQGNHDTMGIRLDEIRNILFYFGILDNVTIVTAIRLALNPYVRKSSTLNYHVAAMSLRTGIVDTVAIMLVERFLENGENSLLTLFTFEAIRVA